MASENVLELTDESFEAEVIQSDLPVLVDFWADYCMPCKMIAPMVAELADEYAGRLRVGKVDTGTNRQVAINYGIQAIPTLLIIKDGQIAGKFVGMQTKSDLKSAIDKLLG